MQPQLRENPLPNTQDRRLLGAYPQSRPGLLMLRTKVPGGRLSSAQARGAADLCERLAGGTLHLTTRMSLEFHDLPEARLGQLLDGLDRLGLSSRGACGGAVRGVAVSTPFAPGADEARRLAEEIHDHFSGVTEFEGLPKKFKVGVDAGYAGSRCRIQDAGLVWVGGAGEAARFDLWIAGGLGREPREGFRFEADLARGRVIPSVEAVVRTYRAFAAPGKRLKHVAAAIGAEDLARRIRAACDTREAAGPAAPTPCGTARPGTRRGLDPPLLARVFAGQLAAPTLRALADLAAELGDGWLTRTPDQDVAVGVSPDNRRAGARALAELGLGDGDPEGGVVLRVCPGNHQCRVGLAPTRDLARALVAALGDRGRRLTWAVSGCPNSCAQPQLADVGIQCVKAVRESDGARRPRFDLLRRDGPGLGTPHRRGLTTQQLLAEVEAIG